MTDFSQIEARIAAAKNMPGVSADCMQEKPNGQLPARYRGVLLTDSGEIVWVSANTHLRPADALADARRARRLKDAERERNRVDAEFHKTQFRG